MTINIESILLSEDGERILGVSCVIVKKDRTVRGTEAVDLPATATVEEVRAFLETRYS
jgi:hypothetical protein